MYKIPCFLSGLSGREESIHTVGRQDDETVIGVSTGHCGMLRTVFLRKECVS